MYIYRAKVISVYDGDTCRVDIDMGFNLWVRNQSIRWNGINTPEITGSERPDGLVSKQFIADMILDKEVIIQTYKAGKYGRWLGTFWLPYQYPDELTWEHSINQLLIDEGLAVEYMKEGG